MTDNRLMQYKKVRVIHKHTDKKSLLKVLFVFVFLFSFSLVTFSQSIGSFRSKVTTGVWNVASSWERYNGTTWVAADIYPGQIFTNNYVQILEGHVITSDTEAEYSFANLYILGELRLTKSMKLATTNSVTLRGGVLNWAANNVEFTIQENAILNMTEYNGVTGSIKYENNCTGNQFLYRGTLKYSVCQGASAPFSFEQVNESGGTMNVDNTSYPTSFQVGGAVTLQAEASGNQSQNATFTWEQRSGPEQIPINNYTTQNPGNYTLNVAGTYVFRVTASVIVDGITYYNYEDKAITVTSVGAPEPSYKTCSNNYVSNSEFGIDPDNSPTVTNWTFSPSGDAALGWKEDDVLIYGKNIFIDRLGTYTATPTLNNTPCENLPKVVKFYYNAGNTGAFTFNVKLGTRTIASFEEWGYGAGSLFEPGFGVTSSIIDRRFIGEGPISGNMLWNNVWHEVTLLVPGYGGGQLSFEYTRTGGISRQVRLDNVQLYEAIPTPIPTQTEVFTSGCNVNTYNLTTLQPASSTYNYAWYTSPNPTAETQVSNPATAPVGTYYLVASSDCPQSCTSNPSVAVTVKKPDNCCGSNKVVNGTFANDLSGWTPSNNTYVKRVTSSTYQTGDSGADPISPLPSDGFVKIYSFGTLTSYHIDQTVSGICTNEKKRLTFDIAIDEESGDYGTQWVKLGDATLITFYPTYVAAPYTWTYSMDAGATMVSIIDLSTNTTATTPYLQTRFYRVTIDIPSTVTSNVLSFWTRYYFRMYIDNVSLSNLPPDKPIPTSNPIATTCPNGTANLNNYLPTGTPYKYEWHVSNDITSALVADPTKALPGKYYLFAVSPCSGCVSAGTEVIVTQTCPVVSGKVFADYDGPNVNGISNPTGLGASGGGLFAHLVNSSNVVINSIRVKNDGTYSLTGSNGTGLKIIINRDSIIANGTNTLSTSTLNPNYLHTGDVVGGTTGSTTNDGISAVFSLTASQTLTDVNFGIQSPPIAADASGTVCVLTTSHAFTIPPLHGVDDDPNFNNGIGKKIIITTINPINGTLAYDGDDITTPYTIAEYEHEKLVFTTGPLPEPSRVQFTYVFEDLAGTQSQEPGVIDYTLNVRPSVNDYSITIASGGTFTYTPVHGINGVVPDGTTYTWSAPVTPAGVDGYASGTAQPSVTGTLTNTTTTAQTVVYTVTANSGENTYCDDTQFTVTVTVRGIANYWMGGTGTTLAEKQHWGTAANWTAAYIPETGQDIEFATVNNNGTAAVNDLHLDTDRIIGSLINATGLNTVVTTGNQLTVQGTVQNTSTGTLVVQSATDQPTGTLLFTHPETNDNVQATVQFYNKGYNCNCGFYPQKWQYFGIPVTSSAFPYSNPIAAEKVNQWVEPWSTDINKWRPAPYTPDTELKAFKGYEITNTINTTGTNLPMYSFAGTLVTGDKEVSLTKTANVNYSGMNLIGNSYTAAIPINRSAISFSNEADVEQTVYLFNTGTRDEWRKLSGSVASGINGGQYLSVPINLAGSELLPKIIPSMHAFMVRANAVTTLTLKYNLLQKNDIVSGVAWRSTSQTPHLAPRIPHLVMDIIGPQSADRVWLFENPSTTRGFDNGWDGTKMLETEIAQLYVSGTNNHKFQVATVPQIAGTTFGFNADTNGNYTLSFALSDDVSARTLYIRDTKTGVTHRINRNTEITFSAAKGDNGNRFVLVTEEEIKEKVNRITAYSRDQTISVVNDTEENCHVQVFDITGRMVLQQNIPLKSLSGLQRQLQKGVYLLKITGKTVNEVKRVVVD